MSRFKRKKPPPEPEQKSTTIFSAARPWEDPTYDSMRPDKRRILQPTPEEYAVGRRIIITAVRRILAEQEEGRQVL